MFKIIIFLGSFLLFLVQPMLAKAMLPYFGGSASLWNVSMMFYQFLLLAGYFYATIITKKLGFKGQGVLHLVIAGISLVFIPVFLDGAYLAKALDTTSPIIVLILALAGSISLPFFVLSCNSTLTQYWYGNVSKNESNNPYHLYVISNIGSFTALILYPVLIEPFFGLSTQIEYWGYFYYLYLLLLAALVLSKVLKFPNKIVENIKSQNISFTTKLTWLFLAFIPSSLMLGTTYSISTDLGSFPLLWVLILSLYLLSFILAFNDKQKFYKNCSNAQVNLTLVCMLTPLLLGSMPSIIMINIFAFFAVAVVCHSRLYLLRPEVTNLPIFYLYLSIGGFLGGVFNNLIAPYLFIDAKEFVLVMLLALLARRNKADAPFINNVKYILYYLLILTCLCFITYFFADYLDERIKELNEFLNLSKNKILNSTIILLVLAPFAALAFLSIKAIKNATAIFLLFSAFYIFQHTTYLGTKEIVYESRNFYGTLYVEKKEAEGVISIKHGTTTHGIQSLGDDYLQVTSYYRPIEDVIAAMGSYAYSKPMALVGLGAGTSICYAKQNQEFDLYEINPEVVYIASNPKYFKYMAQCPAKQNVILGDARIKISKADNARYSLIILDAYSSDSVPFHLTTKEAIEIYLSKLDKNGALAFHVSNRYYDLEKILYPLAEKLGLKVTTVNDNPQKAILLRSQWVVLTYSEEVYSKLNQMKGWQDNSAQKAKYKIWTDEFYSAISVLR